MCLDFLNSISCVKVDKIYYYDIDGKISCEKLKNMKMTYYTKGDKTSVDIRKKF